MNFKNKTAEEKAKLYKIAIILVLLLGIAVKCIKFGVLMDQTQSDEMGSGYDAYCLLHYGTDRYGYSWPVYFINYGGGQNALYTYVCVLTIKLLGYSKFAIRLPALLFSALGGIFGTLLTGQLIKDTNKSHKAMLLFAILYAVAPYTFMASRFALESNLMFSCSTVFLYFLVRAHREKKNLFYLLSGIFAGITLYTYAIAYIVLPVMLFLSIIYMIRTKQVNLINVVLFIVPLAILAMPLILVQYVNYFDKEQFQLGIFTITKFREYRSGEISFDDFFPGIFKGYFSVLCYDGLGYNTNKNFFTFYPMSIPFFFYGFYILVKKAIVSIKERIADGNVLVIFWVIGQTLVAGLMTEPNTNRMNGMIFPVMFMTILGIYNLIDNLPKSFALPSWCTLAAVYGIYFAIFLYSYFTVIAWQRVTTTSMCPEGYQYIQENEQLKEKVVVSNIPPQFFAATALPSPDKVDYEGNYKDEKYAWFNTYEYPTLRDYFYNVGGVSPVYLIYNPTEDDMAVMEENGAIVKQFGYSFYLYYWE
ncbi:ArnT family glycosyltransferase [Butyrivibrio sp. VCB2006]|uniref:ArnT family glycosyltransferase n=1 Tax=Butyrivibrio sp. VCB2006 TaxID=1280679 RepID=UPI000422F84C|nr:glycosyltransferase family 39 protein [Butyrivibrio sp. VCB2006]